MYMCGDVCVCVWSEKNSAYYKWKTIMSTANWYSVVAQRNLRQLKIQYYKKLYWLLLQRLNIMIDTIWVGKHPSLPDSPLPPPLSPTLMLRVFTWAYLCLLFLSLSRGTKVLPLSLSHNGFYRLLYSHSPLNIPLVWRPWDSVLLWSLTTISRTFLQTQRVSHIHQRCRCCPTSHRLLTVNILPLLALIHSHEKEIIKYYLILFWEWPWLEK